MLDLGTLRVKLEADTDAATGKLNAFQKAGAGVTSALKTAGAVAATSAVAAGGAVAALAKQSLDAYASYEQLVGGVDTLFKDASKEVQQYASVAYKTAGLSANQYMETVTSFSASLLQSLGGDTQKAAKYADQAVVDMSDNANKMGTSMESIQNAYQGFAKQNYTMLDNLKLGYGGTKSEMERLIADANKVKEANGEMADLSIDSFADVTEAIHIIQTEMGITGTTAKEASTTIEGSVNTMKASWQNWLTELGKENGDIEGKTKELVESVGNVIKNVVPVIQRIVPGIVEGMKSLVGAAIDYLKTNGPSMLAAAQEWIGNMISGIADAVPKIVEKAGELIKSFTSGLNTSGGGLNELRIKGMELVRNLINGIVHDVFGNTWEVLFLITILLDMVLLGKGIIH